MTPPRSDPPGGRERGRAPDVLVFLLASSVALSAYLRTLSPTIAGGDAGELVAEGCRLGTAHPPGYPLYTLLVYAITELGRAAGAGSESARWVNGMSAVFGAAASGLVASCVCMLSGLLLEDRNDTEDGCARKAKKGGPGKRRKKAEEKEDAPKPKGGYFEFGDGIRGDVVAVAAPVSWGLLHAFSPLAWQYSVIAEVFSLHNLFVALIVHTAIRFGIQSARGARVGGTVVLGAFLCGLSLTNQHTSVLLELPLVPWVVWTAGLLRPRNRSLLFGSALAFLLGLAPYAALPYLASTNPRPGSWGDVTTLGGFAHHLLRRDYGTLRLYSGGGAGGEGAAERTALWIADFTSSAGGGGGIAAAAFLAAGCAALAVRPARSAPGAGAGAVLVASLGFYLAAFHSLSNLPLSDPLLYGIHKRFWMHPNVLAFVISGAGSTAVFLRCEAALGGSRTDRTEAGGMSRARALAPTAFSVALLALAARSYRANVGPSDHSDNRHLRNYALAVLESLPRDALLFINYDQQWTSVRYLQECEGVRADVTSINLSMMSYSWWETKRHLYPHLTFPGTHYTQINTRSWQDGGFTFSELLDANYASRGGDVYIGGALNYDDPRYRRTYEEVPHGLVRRAVRREGWSGDAEGYRSESARAWRVVAAHLLGGGGLPDPARYTRETWEWTVRREFYDHMVSRAAFLLDLAVPSAGTGPALRSLEEAAAWMEVAGARDPEFSGAAPSLWKNLGLAYLHMVRSDGRGAGDGPTEVEDIFAAAGDGAFMKPLEEVWWDRAAGGDWKTWASQQWSGAWGKFLDMEGAEDDPSYGQIKSIYDSVMKSVGGRK